MAPVTTAKVNNVWRLYLVDRSTNYPRTLILKVGNSRWKIRKTRTEANALTYLTNIPEAKAPEVLAFEDQAEYSEIGMEFILMTELPVRCIHPLPDCV
jgi:hypothetical protein